MEQEPSWQRQLLIGVSALLAIGLLVGGILAVIAVKAADYAGIGAGDSTPGPNPILPTTGDATRTAAPHTRSPSSSPSAPTSRPPHRTLTLQASPPKVGSFERINLTGRYPGHDGATLQVQRSLGNAPFSDFPTDTSVSGGAYATYIQTSMVGVNHLRMLDKATGRTSNVVTVTVG